MKDLKNTDIHTGHIGGKIHISSFISDYSVPLAMIALVHNRGARKYACYSWYSAPDTSNSTVEDNLDALFRHFGAHSMGQLRDIEGLPHIFHMCCRASMLISTAYKEVLQPHLDLADIMPESELTHQDDIGHQLPIYTLLTLSKTYLYRIPVTEDELVPFIINMLVRCSLIRAGKLKTEDATLDLEQPILTKYYLDRLVLAIFRYADLFWERNKHLDLVDMNTLTDADKVLFETYLLPKSEEKSMV
jgi:hypothetical protein